MSNAQQQEAEGILRECFGKNCPIAPTMVDDDTVTSGEGKEASWMLEHKPEHIAFCGDDCLQCPRYHARTEAELSALAHLWHRIGWRDRVLPAAEMRCSGCSPAKRCAIHLPECTRAHGVEKCGQCALFPCEKTRQMLRRMQEDQVRCKEVCSPHVYAVLEAAFFHKEDHLKK